MPYPTSVFGLNQFVATSVVITLLADGLHLVVRGGDFWISDQ